MSCLSLNYRGLENPQIEEELVALNSKKISQTGVFDGN